MSGHSKWSTIKRQKGVTDAKRGQAFTKAANAVTLAAREGGDPDMNFKLRLAIEAARAINMPKNNIDRAIARGTGASKEGQSLQEVIYEGFGPGGVAVLVESVTDNRARTVQEVRSTFERSGGNLAGPGSVAHIFLPVGEIVVASNGLTEEEIFLNAVEAGATDVETAGEEAIIYCKQADLEKVKEQLTNLGMVMNSSGLSRKASSSVKIEDEKQATAVTSLISKLEDLADVQKVYANFDVPEDVLEKVTG